MALDAGRLVLVSYPKDDPLGAAQGTLTDSYRRSVTVEDNGIGHGSFAIHPDSAQLAWCDQDDYIAAWRDTVSGSPIAGFWVDTIGEVVLSPDEDGGLERRINGRGPIAILEEAVVWHRAKSGTGSVVYPAKGEWRWKNAHPARPLVRLIEEAQARGCLPGVTVDFTRTTDSDGSAWSTDNADEFSFRIGMNLLDVVRVLRESGLHLTMDAGLVLHAWDTYDNDLSASIGFVAGTDIRDTSEIEAAARRGKSAVVVEGENKNDARRYRAVTDATLETALGRRKEGFFRYQRTATKKVLQRVGTRKLAKWKKQHDGPFVLGVIDTTSQVALVDYQPGDTIAVPTDFIAAGKERIAAITLSEISNGEYDPTLEMGDLAPDPVSGVTPSGDVEGGGCCGGSDGVGGKPGGGGGGGAPGGGGGGGTPPGNATYRLDDFDRTIFSAPTSIATATTSVAGVSISLAVPDGSDVIGRAVVVLVAWDQAPATDPEDELVSAGWSRFGGSTESAAPDFKSKWLYRVIDGTEGFSGTVDSVTLTLSATSNVVAVAELLEDFDPALDWAYNPGTTADPDSLTGSGGDPVRFYAALMNNSTSITGDPSGYSAVAETAVTSQIRLRVVAKSGTNVTEDPSTFTSGDARVSYTFRLTGGTGGGWGSIPEGQGVDTEAPWVGGNPWTIELSNATASVTGTAGTLTATADGAEAQAYIDEDTGPGGSWGNPGVKTWRFKTDPLGDYADANANTIDFLLYAAGWLGTARVHLGDAVTYSYGATGKRGLVLSQQGIAVYSAFVEKTLLADTYYELKTDNRGGRYRARLWLSSSTEPSSWDIDVEMLYEDTATSSLGLLFYANNGMTLTLDSVDVAAGVESGGSVGRHFLAYGDGSTVTFDVGQAYAFGALLVWVDNQPVVPTAYDADAGTFTLGRAPYGDPADSTGSAIIEVAYEAA